MPWPPSRLSSVRTWPRTRRRPPPAEMPEPAYLMACRINLVERPVRPAGAVGPAGQKVEEAVRSAVEAGGHGLAFEFR
jgi:hypothetical protein